MIIISPTSWPSACYPLESTHPLQKAAFSTADPADYSNEAAAGNFEIDVLHLKRFALGDLVLSRCVISVGLDRVFSIEPIMMDPSKSNLGQSERYI